MESFNPVFCEPVKQKQDHIRDEISRIAYFKWIDAGSPLGDGSEFWLAAEHEYIAKVVKANEVNLKEFWLAAEYEYDNREFLKKLNEIEEIKKEARESNPMICPYPPVAVPTKKKDKKEVAISADHPQMPLQSKVKSFLERLFPILAKIRSDTSPLKDCEK